MDIDSPFTSDTASKDWRDRLEQAIMIRSLLRQAGFAASAADTDRDRDTLTEILMEGMALKKNLAGPVPRRSSF